MIEQIAELNRVLLVARALAQTTSNILVEDLINGCKGVAIEARMPDHEQSIAFSVQVGLLQRVKRNTVLVTSLGFDFLELNPKRGYDLSNRQKQYLIRSLFFDGAIKKQVRECLTAFVFSEKKKTYWWSALDGTPFGDNTWIVVYMEQLGLLRQKDNDYLVTSSYIQSVSDFIHEPKGYTEEQLLGWLEEKKKLGDAAEKLILDFERSRLKNLGHVVESKCIKPVGKLNTSAGYDIESFNAKAKGMQFDRFIEVKGSGNPKLRFVWTQNEMKVAEKLRDRYWIYYQGGINKSTGKSAFKPIMIQNPFENLPKDSRYVQVANGMVVESHLQGAKV